MYHVNTDTKEFHTPNARTAAEVAVTWKGRGMDVAAYAIVDGDPTRVIEVPITTVKETAKQLANTQYRYTVRRPISSDRNLDREGMIVSRHRSLDAAMRSLARQQRGARMQGGFSQDYIWDELEERRVD